MTSGSNTIALAIGAMYSLETNPITQSLAVSVKEAILQALPLLKADVTEKNIIWSMSMWHLPRTSLDGVASQALSSAYYVTDTYTEA
jgi:alcohol dehydrogenase class IV